MGWWHSPESLGRLLTLIMWAALVVNVLTGAAAIMVRNRRDSLLALSDRVARIERDTTARHLTKEQSQMLTTIVQAWGFPSTWNR